MMDDFDGNHNPIAFGGFLPKHNGKVVIWCRRKFPSPFFRDIIFYAEETWKKICMLQ